VTEAELVQKLRQQLQACAGFDGDELAKSREQALDYYFQRPRGDEVIGRSRVVSGDVSAMVEANLAQMLEAFTTDDIVEFHASGPEDEDQAELESVAVTDFVMGQNPGYIQFATAIKDALLLRNGICKVWAEQQVKIRTERFTNVQDEAIGEILKGLAAAGVECKVTGYKDGNLTVRCTQRRQVFRCEALPPENFLYVHDWDSLDLQAIPFCAERHVEPRSNLLELGFPRSKVDKLPKYQQRTGEIQGAARNPKKWMQAAVGIDASQDLVEWFECYALMDSDGDGISERRKLCFAQTSVLANDPVNLVPYAAGTAVLNPHRFLGVSLFDKLKQVQDLNTGLQRALMDNVNTTNKNRLAYLDGRVNVDDLADGRTNGALRVKNTENVQSAVMAFSVPDTSANILRNIESQKATRTELGGASLELASGQLQIGDRVGSEGIDRAYSVMEALAAMMTKLIAASLIKQTFALAHATLRESFNTEVNLKRHGKWLSAVPAKWPERTRLTVKPGMSPGERQRRAAALMQILESQIALAREGMDEVLVNIEGFYAVLMDWCRAVDIHNPEQYFRDPASPEAKQALQSKQTQAKAAEDQKRALMQQAIELEQIRTALGKYKADQDTVFKYFEAVLGAEIEEAKITGAAVVDIIKAKQVANGQARNATPGGGAPKESPTGGALQRASGGAA
jgi:hypothetical protein